MMKIPELDVSILDSKTKERYSFVLQNSQIESFSPTVEVWTSRASSKALAYYSHGIFRYFGKFPPPIARHLIKHYTKVDDLVIDPMCGCGTTGLEALLLGRRARCYDINPLAVLISKVKITKLNKESASEYLEKVMTKLLSTNNYHTHVPVGLKNYDHWFLPKTITSLSQIKNAIEDVNPPEDIKNALVLSYLAIVRRVSRATTQQGRLFLDALTAEENAVRFFSKKAKEVIKAVSSIPSNSEFIYIEQGSILDSNNNKTERSNLVICHPPYFNSYRYSSVNSLELSWMGINHAHVRDNEIREAFKVGKIEKVNEYLDDLEKGLRNIAESVSSKGILALMIGDTILKGNYIPITIEIIHRLHDCYTVEKAALRIPQFTEASWATSQRRNGSQLGINLLDMIIILRKNGI